MMRRPNLIPTVLFLVLFIGAVGVSAADIEPAKDAPEEIRSLSKNDYSEPAISSIVLDSTVSVAISNATAAVWTKFKAARDGSRREFSVVYCSHPGFGLEEKALEVVRGTVFGPPKISHHKPYKWLYHVVVFNKRSTTEASPEEPSESRGQQPAAADSGKWVAFSGQLEEPPELVTPYPPKYPLAAKVTRRKGTVLVRVFVDTLGTVKSALVGESSGMKDFDDAAVEAAYRYKFKPAMSGGRPVACWATYRVDFAPEGH